MQKFQMSCCAMCQVSMSDNESLEDIKAFIKQATAERNQTWNPQNRDSGETLLQVTVSPHENNLRTNLIKLGFKLIQRFPRRKGYPQTGLIELYHFILPLN